MSKNPIQDLVNGLEKYLKGSCTLEDIEDKYTSPIIATEDELSQVLPQNVMDIVYKLDMWDVENWSRDDVVSMHKELVDYLNQSNLDSTTRRSL